MYCTLTDWRFVVVFVVVSTFDVFHGWPSCSFTPDSLQSELSAGLGATFCAWGSHAAELGFNKGTDALFLSDEFLNLDYFTRHPTIFPLTTAANPARIPEKFGRQYVIRNNERVFASNHYLIQSLMIQRSKFAPSSGGSGGGENWIPLMDWFSPTHAAYEQLAQDAVHWKPYRFFFFSLSLFIALPSVPSMQRARAGAWTCTVWVIGGPAHWRMCLSKDRGVTATGAVVFEFDRHGGDCHWGSGI